MGKEIISIPNAPKLPFSPAIRAGQYIFLSGQGGALDPKTGDLIEGIEAQTKQCLENIKQILAAAGSSLGHVVKVTVFLANAADFNKMNEAYQSYFPEGFPARSTAITGLVHPAMLIEIECIAFEPLVEPGK